MAGEPSADMIESGIKLLFNVYISSHTIQYQLENRYTAVLSQDEYLYQLQYSSL
jgi:hypothetical protein